VASLGALGAAPAYAATGDTAANNTKTQYLTASPTDVLSDSCKSRSIYLAEDDYYWVQDHDRMTFRGGWTGEWIPLKAGWYSWLVCMDPYNGYYIQESQLSLGSQVWTRTSKETLSTSGTITWGDTIIPSSGA
jgi:hypothetical protein